ncbi:NAD-dependent deacetylase sirtuin-2 [Auriculariales sp. MPI-PUGE-AT-0066]|nr:NAD-dependent deacetylase sirtuin-2 [Auriculariales sp. MPI-PUGE-AT-0066]
MSAPMETHQELIARMLARVPSEPALKSKDLEGVVEFMKRPECKKILVMAGAGISTSAGIPDFRSPGTGLYDNLQKYNLPYPQAIFELKYFREHPEPFFALARELAPGSYRPTVTHSFIRLLAEKGMLQMCFTQNIDTLERQAGVPLDLIIEAHGSFAGQHCIDCKAHFPEDVMKTHLKEGTVARCTNVVASAGDTDAGAATRTETCNGLVKPDIVFFGEPLPSKFFDGFPHTLEADLLLIMGTSLKVHPFASLAEMGVCPRVLVNLTDAGDIGTQRDDVVILQDTDSAVREIARGMGWQDELDALWEKTKLDLTSSEAAESTSTTETVGQAELATVQSGLDDLAGELDRLGLATSDQQEGDGGTDKVELASERS